MAMGLADTRSQPTQVNAPEPAQSDLDDVRVRVQSSGTSFYWAMRLLPEKRREALFAIYAFCREVDDIADGDLPHDQKITELHQWREKIDRAFDGQTSDPITRALIPSIATFDLQKKDFLAVIDGMEMDARGPIVAPSLQTLDLYCDRVASAVGRLCVRAFGEATPEGEQVANDLGRALQLTNIMRDVREDAAIGRLYLPLELLQHAGIETTNPSEVVSDPRLPQVINELAKHAESAFEHAEIALAKCSKTAMRPAVIMMMVYRKHFERLRKNEWCPLPAPTGLKRLILRLEKFWIAIRYGFL